MQQAPVLQSRNSSNASGTVHIPDDMPNVELPAVKQGLALPNLLKDAGLVQSTSEAIPLESSKVRYALTVNESRTRS